MAKEKSAETKPAKQTASKEDKDSLKEISDQLQELLQEENTTLDTLYIVGATDDEVTLEINVEGEGQTSDMTVRLGNREIVKEHAGDLQKVSLGSNKELNGKKLSIAAIITDTSRKTNFTGLKIRLRGGMVPADFPLAKTVDEEGQSADYLCLIEFFKP